MFKPYNTYDEIPGKVKKEICLGNKVFKVTDVPLKDINSFYSGLDDFLQTTEKKVLAQRILKQLDNVEKVLKGLEHQVDDVEDRVQGIYDKVV
tara:strand:- start:30 stop:308 length:279 start_codon:yes stop_codon:yes gene_type:complete